MRTFLRHRTRFTAIKHSALLRGLTIIILVCVLVRAAAAMGAERAAVGLLQKLGGNAAVGILDFELGRTPPLSPGTALGALFYSPGTSAKTASGLIDTGFSDGGADLHHAPLPSDTPDKAARQGRPGGLFYGAAPPSETAATPPVPPSPLNVKPPASAEDILLDNQTDYAIDAAALLSEPLGITLAKDKPAVLIIQTHTSEAFTQSGSDTYEESDPFRTENQSQNITRIGDEIAAAFEERGIQVIHDKQSYDFPSYTGCYTRSYESIRAYLEKYPSIKLVLDIHRDSIETSDGKQYKTVAQIGDVKCSQVMMVVGTDAAGLQHPKWRENLKLALNLQHEMNVLSPTLTRPVRISQYRYNQQATSGSLIIEIGCAGNTLEESILSAQYFADAAANVMLGMYG